MNAKLRKFFSIALLLCLALTFSAVGFADGSDEPVSARYIPCPYCTTGRISEYTIYGYIYTEPPKKHLGHWDFVSWNIDLLVRECDRCSFREEIEVRRNHLQDIVCQGFPR